MTNNIGKHVQHFNIDSVAGHLGMASVITIKSWGLLDLKKATIFVT
jgi:hypothetical protein